MTEIDGVAKGPGGVEGSLLSQAETSVNQPEKDREKEGFQPSPLFREEKDLASITHPDLRQKAESLHEIALRDPGMEVFGREQWFRQYEELCELMANGQVCIEEAIILAGALNRMIGEYDKKEQKVGGGRGLGEEVADGFSQVQRELSRQAYEGSLRRFLQAEEWGTTLEPEDERTILVNAPEKDRQLLLARIALLKGRFFKFQVFAPDNLSKNEALRDMTKEKLNLLCSQKGVTEAWATYLVLATTPDYANQRDGLWEKLRELKVTHIFDYVKDYPSLSRFRGVIREYLRDSLGLSEEQARDVEQIAFNLFLVSDVAEWANSIYGALGERKRAQSFIVNIAQYDLIHPLEKALEARGRNQAWPSGPLGEFVRYHKDYGPDRIPIPPTLSGKDGGFTFLHSVKYGDKTLYLRQEGIDFISGKKISVDSVDWLSVEGENPFNGYYFTKSKQIFVWQVLFNGSLPQGRTMSELRDALNALEIETEGEQPFRKALVYLLNPLTKESLNIDPRAKTFEPNWRKSSISRDGFWDRVVKLYPGIVNRGISFWGRILGV